MSLRDQPPLSLYIHIPWCERKCPYCDFNSHQAETTIPEQAYVQALLTDLEQDLPYAQGRQLSSIFIGGGTPSLFAGASLKALLQGVQARIALHPQVEITLEANPGSAEANKFAQFVDAGVNRLSLGIQSFQDAQLQQLGRVHNSEQAAAAVALANDAGLNSFNIDLMHGLPGQTIDGALADLQRALSFNPPHLSWYQLTLEPKTEFYTRPPTLPVEDTLADIQLQGEALLAKHGFSAYEVSAYGKPGVTCRHNLNYWQFGDYIGIGAGAHGKLTDLDNNTVWRTAKTRQPDAYLRAEPGQFCSQRKRLGRDDLKSEYMLNALRLVEGFEPAQFQSRTGLDIAEIMEPVRSLQERELLVFEGGRIRASALGRRFLDTVITEFL
jgi:putative oxygen-independent coproporphyrinogen III oxidase